MNSKIGLSEAAIRQLVRIAKKYSQIETLPIQVDGDVKITTGEAHAIQVIGKGEPVRVIDLAAHHGITKSAASQMASKLLRKGFIEKNPAPANNKEYLLSLTELGRKAYQAHEKFHGKDFTELTNRLSSFSLSQIATISVLLDIFENIIDERLALLEID